MVDDRAHNPDRTAETLSERADEADLEALVREIGGVCRDDALLGAAPEEDGGADALASALERLVSRTADPWEALAAGETPAPASGGARAPGAGHAPPPPSRSETPPDAGRAGSDAHGMDAEVGPVEKSHAPHPADAPTPASAAERATVASPPPSGGAPAGANQAPDPLPPNPCEAPPSRPSALPVGPPSAPDESVGDESAPAAIAAEERVPAHPSTGPSPVPSAASSRGPSPVPAPGPARTPAASGPPPAVAAGPNAEPIEDGSGPSSDDPGLRDMDGTIAEDVEALLQGNFDTVSDVLDGEFDDADSATRDDLPRDGRSAGQIGHVVPRGAGGEIPDPAFPDGYGGPATGFAEAVEAGESRLLPARRSVLESVPLPPRGFDAEPDPGGDAEERLLDAGPATMHEHAAAPEPAAPPEAIDAAPVPPDRSPRGRLAGIEPILVEMLEVVNYPLRLLPSRFRPVVDWIALSLIFWVPIVWFVALFVIG